MASNAVTPNTSNPWNFPVYPAEVYLKNEFWLKKMAYFLDFIDLDRNGVLDEKDKEIWVKNTTAEVKRPLSPEEIEAFRIGVDHSWQWWGVMPGGPTLTKKECIKHMAEKTLQIGCVERIKTISDRWFNLCDEDQDGFVSWEEFFYMQKGVGPVNQEGRDLAAEAQAAFKAIDEDGDGVITRDEWAVAARGFFIGIDPESPSRFFFCDFDKMAKDIVVPELD